MLLRPADNGLRVTNEVCGECRVIDGDLVIAKDGTATTAFEAVKGVGAFPHAKPIAHLADRSPLVTKAPVRKTASWRRRSMRSTAPCSKKASVNKRNRALADSSCGEESSISGAS